MKPIEKKAKLIFSRYVRLRDCANTTGSLEYGKCFTCGKVFPIEQLQCGHFISGRTNALFFVPENSHAQCIECNCVKGGNLKVYREKMIKKYGIDKVYQLKEQRHTMKRITEEEFEIKFSSCKKAISVLELEY